MTDPVVGIRPALIPEQDLKSGRAVREGTWAAAAGLSNHLLGRGRCLIPPTRIFTDPTAFTGGTEYVFRFRVKPSLQALEREWVFSFDDLLFDGITSASNPSGPRANTTYLIEVPNGGTAITHVVAQNEHSTLSITESVGSQSDTDMELTCAITPSAVTSSGREITVSCWEKPRATLVMDSTDLGANVGELRVAAPIKAELLTILTANAAQTTILKRGGYFHWSQPATAGGATTTAYAVSSTSSTHVPIFAYSASGVRTAIGIPILVPKYYRTSTTGTVQVRVLGWTSSGATTLSVRATTSRTGTTSSAVTTSATTPTWLTAISLPVDCEDLSTDNGLRGPDTLELVNVEFARSAGAGTVYVAAVSIFD